jgi:hypothetical protein
MQKRGGQRAKKEPGPAAYVTEPRIKSRREGDDGDEHDEER